MVKTPNDATLTITGMDYDTNNQAGIVNATNASVTTDVMAPVLNDVWGDVWGAVLSGAVPKKCGGAA
jgi:hypothetical protein